MQPGLPPKEARYERWRWQIFAITWLAYAGFYLTRKSFSVAKIGIGEGTALGLSQADLSRIDGAFLIAYAVGQFLWGMAGDRFGARIVVLLGLGTSVLAALAMGFSSTALFLGVLFFIQGLAQSTGWAPLSKNLSNFFSRNERGLVMGLWCTNYALGGLVASIFAGWLGERFGWRYAFWIPALVLLGIMVLFYFAQRNRPEDVGLPPIETYRGTESTDLTPDSSTSADPSTQGSAIVEVLRNPVVLLLCAVYFCLKPARYAILFWGPQYVNFKLGTGMLQSGFVSAMFELAGPFSVLFAGLISDRLFQARRMPISIVCLVLLAGVLFVLDNLPATPWMLGGALFVIGLLTYAPDSLVSGTAAIDFGTKRGASTASGLVNGCGSIGAIVGGTLPGFFQKQWGWNGVFTFLAVSVLLAALILLPKWNAVPGKPK